MDQKDCGGRRLYATRRRASERGSRRHALAPGLAHRRSGPVSALTGGRRGDWIWPPLISLFMRH